MIKNPLLFILGWFFFLIGVIGIFLPILPTTPFILLAAFFFSKSSERWHQWLISRPYLGQLVLDWEEHRVISPKAKGLSCFMIAVLLSYPIALGPIPVWAKILLVIIGLCVMGFILSRKSFRS